jgi:predicted nuclease of predicted toxin-antitoxin system
MKILVDMNLSPQWIPALKQAGIEAVHWSSVGDLRAPDHLIMDFARKHDYIVFTHDLDFGTILAATQAEAPSVIQIRTRDITPAYLCRTVISLLRQCKENLETGALISLDENRHRVRILPLEKNK